MGTFLMTCCSSVGWQLQREGQEASIVINRVSVQLSSLYKKGKQDKEGFNESSEATKQNWKRPVSHF